MCVRLLAIVLAATGMGTVWADSAADRWNLADIYPSVEAWTADAAKLEGQLAQFGGCKGHLGESARRLEECLDLQADMTKRYYRVAAFSGEQVSEDTGNAAYLELDQKSDLLGNRLNEATAFVDPEIIHLGKEKVTRFLAQEPGLSIYRFPLEETLRRAPHTLDDAGEALIATFGLMDNTGGSAYTILTNVDIPWPKVKLADGEERTLDVSAYTKYREEQNRDDRKKVMDAFFGTFKTYERQAMFAEFERNVHARVDKGEPLSGEAFTKTYCDILKRYHGAAEGVVTIDDAYCVEWEYIPQFYNAFYVYQYATSIAASSLFAKRVLEKEPGASTDT